jgi:hypothetical protein
MMQINDSAWTNRHRAPGQRGVPSMQQVTTRVIGAALAILTLGGSALAQPAYYNDMACRQYADQATQPMRDQANSQAVGSTLLGAGLGAALGAAVGGGRGAAIGAASGGAMGAIGGAANSADASGYIQQQWNAYYAQCMSSRSAPAPAYAPAPGYGQPTASQLNQQQLYQPYQQPYQQYPYR